MEFKIQIFQAWKVVQLGVGPGKLWKVNQMVATFLTRVRVFGLYSYIHYHSPLSDLVNLLFNIIVNCVTYSVL